MTRIITKFMIYIAPSRGFPKYLCRFIDSEHIYPKGRLNTTLRFLVFSTPFIVFIIACCLIAYSFILCPHNKDLLNTFGISSECLNSYMDLFRLADFRMWIYMGLYIASFIVFIIGFRVIVIERPVKSRA
jgi:hypothetical protein